MALYNDFILICICSVLYTTAGSLVRVNNGGYEDIVIAIHQDVKEDPKIIENIKNMVKEATHYLFQATRKRLYIKSVKILIPSTWAPSTNYSKPTTETYEEAEVIITSPHLKYGDDPYTLQYGRCGEPGRYIHFTPRFLLDDNLLPVYGPRGRVFVHEWAHLRWGVYDEYNDNKPYYVAGNTKIEATRCSVDIFGMNLVQTSQCHGNNCPTLTCSFDPDTGLYVQGCVFLPDTFQFVRGSIMYSSAPSEITEFCDSSTHNTEAPNLQNRMCNSLSTWEVIMNSTDISSTSPRPIFNVPDPLISLLQHRGRVITLVLDVSGSMSRNDRIGRLHQAADVFLTQIIESSAYVGIVQFATSTTAISSLKRIDKKQREKLLAMIPSTSSYEMTNICPGILAGLEVNKNLDGSLHGTEIVLLTDGEDNFDTKRCYPEIISSGAIVHVVALGDNAEQKLANIADITGGLTFSASKNLNTVDLIDAFTGAVSRIGQDSEQAIQLESRDQNLQPLACLNGTVFIDSTIGNDTIFVVPWENAVPLISLQDPNKKLYDSAKFTSNVTSKLSRLQLPGTAERGRWDYSICNSHTSQQAVGITVTSKAASENVPPILASCHMNKNTNSYPNPMVVYASVSQGLLPVTGVKITAIIKPEGGEAITMELLDNGAGADMAKDDGIYSRYLTNFTINGIYNLNVRAVSEDSNSRLNMRKNGAFYIPGYVNNGKIIINPSRPAVNNDDLQLNVGAFSRTSSGGSFLVSNVPTVPKSDIYKPEKISDLEAQLIERRLVLSWTATGDDLDQGQASSYELRMDTNPKRIKDNFNGSPLINTASLTPLPAGSKETFTFVPEHLIINNGTVIYFAIIAIDKAFKKSDISNIAQSAFYNVPPLPTTEATTRITTATALTPKLTTTGITNATTLTPKLTTTGITNATTLTPKLTTTGITNATTLTPKLTTTGITNATTLTPKLTTNTASNTSASNKTSTLSIISLTLIVCAASVLVCLLVCIIVCILCRKKQRKNKNFC